MTEHRSGDFIWDLEKEADNLEKHGVDFATAAKVFEDSNRVISIDEMHSDHEERHFCVGKVHGRVLTVRFTYREGLIRIYGAGYWRKGRERYEQKAA